ncbi:MAG: hypothetical protein JO020_14410 [Chloroflexi bacterium]|nr:hypothetical protein [Chloroflexota bacterium]
MPISGDVPIDEDALPSLRTRRDVAVVLSFIVLLVILFGLLWLFGPLPQVFQSMCADGCVGIAPIRVP